MSEQTILLRNVDGIGVGFILPRPRLGERRGEFIRRCMGNSETNSEFPEEDQRLAVCNSIWERSRNMMEYEKGMVLQIDPTDDPVQWVNMGPGRGVDLAVDPKTAKVRGIGFCSRKFNEIDDIVAWLGETKLFGNAVSMGKIEGGQTLQLESAESNMSLYAPQFHVTFTRSEEMFQNEMALVIRAIPITPGVHKGFRFSAELLDRIAMMFDGINIVEHHQFSSPASVKGQIRQVQPMGNGMIVVTAIILDEESQALIRQGHFHSVSSHFLLEASELEDGQADGATDEVTDVFEIVELTLTDDPADPNARITTYRDVRIDLPLTNASPPSGDGGSTIEPNGGEQKLSESEQNPPADSVPGSAAESLAAARGTQQPQAAAMEQAAVPVATINAIVDGPAEPANGNASVSLEAEVSALRTQLQNQDQTIQTLLAEKRVERALMTAKSLVLNGKIAPAQEKIAAKLMASMTPDQAGLFEQFLGSNQVAPLGGAAASDAGMVSSENKLVDLSKYSDDDLLLLEAAESTLAAEKGGMFGNEAKKRHLTDPFMGLFSRNNGDEA